MKIASFVIVSLFLASVSFAQSAGLPVLNGRLSSVEEVSLVTAAPTPTTRGGTEVYATIQYQTFCNTPTSFVVIPSANFTYTVIETRIPPRPRTATCSAMGRGTQSILVGTIAGPSPKTSDVTVNGVTAK